MVDQNMAKLDREIEEIEKEVYGAPEEPTVEAEVKEEVVEAIEDNPSEQPPENVEDPQDSEPKPKRVNWKKRFTNYKASSDATIYSLRTDNAELRSQVLDLSKRMDVLLAERTDEKDPFENLFTDEDRDTLGDEALNIFTKASKTAVDSAVSPLKAKLEEERQMRLRDQERMAKNDRQSAYGIFLEKLGDLVPSFNEINVDPGFNKWMQAPDTFSGFPRKDLFHRAEAAGDVSRVAEFFAEYQQLVEKPSEKAQRTLEAAVAPTGSGAAEVTSNVKKPTYLMSEVDKFFTDVSKGKYKGRESLAKELENKYDQAFVDGRIAG